MDQQLLLVVGAPRSGTSWLHQMIAAHPAIAALDKELTVFTYLHLLERHYLKEKFHVDNGHWQQGAPLLYNEDEFYAGLRKIADDAYGKLLAMKPTATHVLDKHPAYALWLPLIGRVYPNVKIIHIIRDGREVVVSMMSAKRRIGFGAGEINGASTDWARHVIAAKNAGAAMGHQRYLEVRYEDLIAHTNSKLAQAFGFCGLEYTEEMIDGIARDFHIENKQVSRGDASLNKLRDVPDAIWKNKLNTKERWAMDRIAGDLLYQLGYARPGWWILNMKDKFNMLLYPKLKRIENTLLGAKRAWAAPLLPQSKH